MSWENEAVAMFNQAKNYKTDEQLMIVKAVVIKNSPLVLASHDGQIVYDSTKNLVLTKTVVDQIQGFREEGEPLVGKQIVCIGIDEFIAMSFT